jgi:hypothetical protein
MKEYNIGTTRFSNKTFKENKQWREKHNWNGCIYGTCIPIAKTQFYRQVDKDKRVFIFEMNNDENKIEGIGLLRNIPRYDFCAEIYSDKNYNRYIYRSNYRLDRKNIPKKILDYFEEILFKGHGHLKRGQGITMINIKWNSVYSSKRQFYLPKNILKCGILRELKKGMPQVNIVKKYCKLHKDLLNFFDNLKIN